jgi:hypothetical protein
MADPVEMTRDITIAWLAAYKTDLAVRRQKGVVPDFTPTNEEVKEFMSAIYQKVLELGGEEKAAKPQQSKKKSAS